MTLPVSSLATIKNQRTDMSITMWPHPKEYSASLLFYSEWDKHLENENLAVLKKCNEEFRPSSHEETVYRVNKSRKNLI